jgi:hypothetical protein
MGEEPGPRHGLKPARALELWAWLLFAAALYRAFVFISETLALPGPGLWFFFSSDTVQYGLLYRDLFEDGFHFSGWNISHAPEYAQMVSALLLRSLAGTLVSGHVLEAMVQPFLLALALRWTFSRLRPTASLLGPAVVAFVLSLIATDRSLDFIAFVWSNRHGYTAILSVVALGLLVETMRGGARVVLLGLVVAAGLASDLLFLAWFVGPALVAILLVFRAAGVDRARRAAAAIVVGAFAGLVVFWAITPEATVGSKLGIQPGETWGALNRISDMAFKTSPERTLSTLAILAACVLALAAVARGQEIGQRLAAAYVLTLCVLTVLAVAATAAPFREAGYTRYLLAPELAGLAVVIVAAHQALGRRGSLVLNLALSAVVLPGLRPLASSVPPATVFYPPLVECLDGVARRHRLAYGVADYWLAKYTTALSRSGLRVMAVTPRLDPFVDFTNVEWFLGGVGARRHDRPMYTFAILGSARPEEPGISTVALNALGPAVAVESCQGYEIRVLPAGSDEKIREQFRSSRRIKDYYARRGLPLP